MSSDVGEQQCKFCGGDDGLALIAVMGQDADADHFDLSDDPILWICDDHYTRLIDGDEYRVRELPDPITVDHSEREVHGSNVVILEPEHEEKWFQAPKHIETDLSENR